MKRNCPPSGKIAQQQKTLPTSVAGVFCYDKLFYFMYLNKNEVKSMTIGDIIQNNDPYTYSKLVKIGKISIESKNKIKLGDSAENLMKADGYKRVGGALRQRHWRT